MTGYNISLPDDFEACTFCRNTGTVTETGASGKSVRKDCPVCRGQGTLRRRRTRTTSDNESEIDDIESDEQDDDPEYQTPQTREGLTAEYTKARDVAELTQGKIEAWLMNRPEPSYDERLQIWVRLQGIRLDASGADGQLDLLAEELRGRLDESLLHEIRYLAILCSRLYALKTLIKQSEG